MPERKEFLDVAGHEVAVSNPDKVFFPAIGLTKMDLVRYYLAVAEGALRGVAGRPPFRPVAVLGPRDPRHQPRREVHRNADLAERHSGVRPCEGDREG